MTNLSGDKLAVGRPDAQVEAGYYYFQYCGGFGGGGCYTPLGVTGVNIFFRIPRFVVRNRRLLLVNTEFFGIRIYTNAGPDGFGCPNSLGVERPFWIAISADGNLTPAQVQSRGVQLSGALPYFIEFTEDKLPQPKESSWAGYLVAQVYWGDPTYINEGNNPPNSASLKIVKHDYDTVI